MKLKIKQTLTDNAIFVVMFFLLLIVILQDTSFFSLLNFSNILTQSSVRLIIALGVAGILITQGTDLSSGRMLGFAGLIAASLLQATDAANKVFPGMVELPLIAVIGIVCLIGAIVGMINGLVIALLNVTPFIATLGTMIIIYGFNSLYFDFTGSTPISQFGESYADFTQGFFFLSTFKLSYITIYAVIITIGVWVLWNKTKFGKNIYAIGGNPEAARVSGVNVFRNLVIVYMLGGILYGFAGFLEAGRIGSATNNIGFMYELDAIAACVVGGVSFAGGIGRVSGVVIGVLIFTIINYGLTYIGVNPYWQYIIKGAIIILAVAIDAIKYKKRK